MAIYSSPKMLSRCFSLRLPLRFRALITTSSCSIPSFIPYVPPPIHHTLPPLFLPSNTNPAFSRYLRGFSSGRSGNDGNGDWKFTPEADELDLVFGDHGDLAGLKDGVEGTFAPEAAAVGADLKGRDPWDKHPVTEDQGDIFDGMDREFSAKEGEGGENGEWETAEGFKPWTLGEDDEGSNLFDVSKEGEVGIEGIDDSHVDALEKESIEEQKQLEKKEGELLVTLKGPNRAFGDLIAASGITEDMIDSLILLKDVRGIQGLPPLTELEDKAIAKMNATSSRTEIERQKQEEIAKSRVRQVDEKGRAYGTGRRKCSIARVWIKPGDGKFVVNEKQFDAYFPIIDHRAELLQPFNVTKTLGLWDVTCTVKGGGVSGQVGAIRLGISRALQNWEPGLRSYLKAAGYLTRDPRVVERKKPGKAKARKSFQWVKR